MPSCSGCGNSTRLDMTKSTTATTGRQAQAAWQVSDIGTELAEHRTCGVKVEDFDTRPTTEVLPDEPSWTRTAARATLDIALKERDCEKALLRNGRWHWCLSRLARMP